MKKFFFAIICLMIGLITTAIFFNSDKGTSITSTASQEKFPNCNVTWVIVVGHAEPTTFWTLELSYCQASYGYVNSSDFQRLEEFKEKLVTELKDNVYGRNEKGVTFSLKNQQYIVVHVAENYCEKDQLNKKLDKIKEYIDIVFKTHKCLEKSMLEDLENFIKEYKI
jgi:hypothetical protein